MPSCPLWRTLRSAVLRSGLSCEVGQGCKRLAPARRQKFARAVLRQPDLLLAQQALSHVDPVERRTIVAGMLRDQRVSKGTGGGVLWHVEDATSPRSSTARFAWTEARSWSTLSEAPGARRRRPPARGGVTAGPRCCGRTRSRHSSAVRPCGNPQLAINDLRIVRRSPPTSAVLIGPPSTFGVLRRSGGT